MAEWKSTRVKQMFERVVDDYGRVSGLGDLKGKKVVVIYEEDEPPAKGKKGA